MFCEVIDTLNVGSKGTTPLGGQSLVLCSNYSYKYVRYFSTNLMMANPWLGAYISPISGWECNQRSVEEAQSRLYLDYSVGRDIRDLKFSQDTSSKRLLESMLVMTVGHLSCTLLRTCSVFVRYLLCMSSMSCSLMSCIVHLLSFLHCFEIPVESSTMSILYGEVSSYLNHGRDN